MKRSAIIALLVAFALAPVGVSDAKPTSGLFAPDTAPVFSKCKKRKC